MHMKRQLWVLWTTLLLVVGMLVLPACKGTLVSQTKTEGETVQTTQTDTDAGGEDATKADPGTAENGAAADAAIDEDGTYTSKDDVALYIHTYGHLPSNFVTKDEAEDAGWKTEGLSLDEACPGKSIGGDRFGNREGKLPKKKGRTWYECDIDHHGERSRGAKRILFSSDGLVYYTEDHYKTFEQLY